MSFSHTLSSEPVGPKFNQTLIDTILGGGRFYKLLVTLTLFLRSHQYFEMSDFDQHSVYTCYLVLEPE